MSALAGTIEYQKLQETIVSLNHSVMQLAHLLMWWDPLSFVEKRMGTSRLALYSGAFPRRRRGRRKQFDAQHFRQSLKLVNQWGQFTAVTWQANHKLLYVESPLNSVQWSSADGIRRLTGSFPLFLELCGDNYAECPSPHPPRAHVRA